MAKSEVYATATQVRPQVVVFQGRQLDSVTIDGAFLAVAARPPRRSRSETKMIPMTQVHAYQEGEGGRANSAFAAVRTDFVLSVTGRLVSQDDDGTVTLEHLGNQTTFRQPNDGVTAYSVTVLDEAATEKYLAKFSGAGKKSSKSGKVKKKKLGKGKK